MSDALLAPLILTVFVALCVLVLLKPLLQKAGVLDIPNERSSHEFPVVRGGGLAQAAGLMIGLGAAIALIDAIERPELMVLLAVSLATASLGWVEDYSGAPISVRASVQFAIGFAAIGVFAALDGRPIAWAVIGGIAFVGLINVVNFMDGINGISAFHAIVAGTTFAALGALNDLNWMIIAGSLLAAAYAAFLPWNLSGRMFLGDVGSYLLGGSIAGIIVLGWMGGVPLIALAAPMTIYLSDTGVTLVERIVAGERWYEAHRDHTYQRLVRHGSSHLTVSSLTALLSSSTAFLGVLSAETEGATRVSCFIGIAIIMSIYTAIRFTVRSPRISQTRLDTEVSAPD